LEQVKALIAEVQKDNVPSAESAAGLGLKGDVDAFRDATAKAGEFQNKLNEVK
jgi:hypothetical protein